MNDEPTETERLAAALAGAPGAMDARGHGGGLDLDDDDPLPPYGVAFTPGNVAVGLGIVAAVVGFLISRRRRRSRAGDD